MLSENNNVRNWASLLDEGTLAQAERTARHPLLAAPLALMPDAHLGAGATIGSVLVTRDGIIPAAVGVDIGCGMIAVETTLRLSQLNLDALPSTHRLLTETIPAGVGGGGDANHAAYARWVSKHAPSARIDGILGGRNPAKQFGTLGSGNHFLEICIEREGEGVEGVNWPDPEDPPVWVVIHSGSRGAGFRIAQHHINIAREECVARGREVEDRDLSYLTADSPPFGAYITDMQWAQDYAYANREVMMAWALNAVGLTLTRTDFTERRVINCHHNYAEEYADPGEPQNGDDPRWDAFQTLHEQAVGRTGTVSKLWITRKGAIDASLNQRGVVPGSMATGTFITSGLGNPLSYNSSAHGAGRAMSRTKAKKVLTVENLSQRMAGIVWGDSHAKQFLDEHPDAYKDVYQVMRDQADLTRPEVHLRQILNFKGG